MQMQAQEVLEHLKAAKSKEDIDAIMLLIRAFGQEWQEGLEASTRAEIVGLIRDKVLECVFQKGDVPDRNVLWAYGIFEANSASESFNGDFGQCERDVRFQSYVDLCLPYVKDTSISYYERLLFIECVAAALLLGGEREKAVQFFLAHIILLALNEDYIVELDHFIQAFAVYYKLPIEWILEIQKRVLEPEVYDALDDWIKKSIFLWSMHIFWNVKHWFNHLKWMENFPNWLVTLKRLLEQGNLDLAMYVSFYIYHKFGNSAQKQEDWQEYNDKIVKLMEPYYVEYGKTLPKCKPAIATEGKIKIGILKDRVVENSPYKVEYSLCKALLSNEEFARKYEIIIYSLNYIQKSDDDMEAMQDLCRIGVSVVNPVFAMVQAAKYYVSHLQKALTFRETILQDGIDVLIATGTIDCADFLFATRSAPRQIFWSHGNGRYDIIGIDKRMSHCSLDGQYKFDLISVPMDKDKFYNPPRSKEAIEAERAKYPIQEDTVVLGVIGRLVKIDSDSYLQCIAEVMQRHKNTIFIAAGSGNAPVIREKVEKLGISERFFMPGFVDSHIYGHIIDIFCDTFPLGQGESLSEFFHKGKTWITLYDVYYKKFEGVMFSNELQSLKFNPKKYLVYIQNINEYKSNLENWDEILRIPGIVILYDFKTEKLIKKINIPCDILCVDKPEILADFILMIKGRKMCLVGAYQCLVEKKPFSFLKFYNDNELYNEYYSKFIVQHQDMFWEDGKNLFRSTYGESPKDYVSNLCYQIEYQKIRLAIGRVIKIQMDELYKKGQSILIKHIYKVVNG